MSDPYRFPAEWETQSAILLAWPHPDTDWAPRLGEVEEAYITLVAAITRFQPVVMCVADDDLEAYAEARLRSNRLDMQRVRFVVAPYNDTWLRDSGPITLMSTQSMPAQQLAEPGRIKSSVTQCAQFTLLDFRFTGWGGKFEASDDDRLIAQLDAQSLFHNAQRQSIDFALEGGAIETDGAGTLLTTWRCLHQRHPQLTREALANTLKHWLRQDRVLWLDHGFLEGDDTDAHIDTLARFAAADAIVFQACDDPWDSHYHELKAMADELAALRTTHGKPYRLFPLPWAKPILEGERRLAASYANFLIVNGAVLMPTYGDAADIQAADVMRNAFPGHEIVQIDCRPIIWQNGSLHCLTMQLPNGLLSTT